MMGGPVRPGIAVIWPKTGAQYRRPATGLVAEGYSLIEVMIVVVVLALLLSLAYPSYQEFLMKSRRTEAKELLYTAAQRQQQFFTMNDTYTTNAAEGLAVPTTSSNGYYTLSITAGHTGNIATSYSMSATPVTDTSQAADTDCGTFTLTSLGVKTVSGSQTTPSCW